MRKFLILVCFLAGCAGAPPVSSIYQPGVANSKTCPAKMVLRCDTLGQAGITCTCVSDGSSR